LAKIRVFEGPKNETKGFQWSTFGLEVTRVRDPIATWAGLKTRKTHIYGSKYRPTCVFHAFAV